MADLRKLLAIAIQGSDLSNDPNEETALDRIGALAFSDRLGSLLWRLRWANDHRAFQPAALLICNRMKHGAETRSIIQAVATQALHEWLDDLCRPCGGRGKLVPKDAPYAKHVCTTCNGTGMRRHSDAARARALGISLSAVGKWESRFARAHAVISAADASTFTSVANQLERRVRGEKSQKPLAAEDLRDILQAAREENLRAVAE